MALKKKTTSTAPKSADKLAELMASLEKEKSVLADQRKKVEKIQREIFDIENAPFKEGDHVLMEVAQGRTRKECECVLSVAYVSEELGHQFKATPIKPDGTLSGRSFIVAMLESIKKV